MSAIRLDPGFAGINLQIVYAMVTPTVHLVTTGQQKWYHSIATDIQII